MTWVVDTCIVIDILENDPNFGLRSATLLEAKLDEGLSICPVTIVELAPAFEGNANEQETFLRQAGIGFREGWTTADTRTAHLAWHQHIAARRSGILPKRPIADVLIGAFATNRRGLITRNPADFRRIFPELQILEP
jgi:predicted nucleic acid-binding protein